MPEASRGITWTTMARYLTTQSYATTAAATTTTVATAATTTPISKTARTDKKIRRLPDHTERKKNHYHHLIYPLTARVVGAPQMISQPISSIFPCSPLTSGTFPDVVFPPLPLSALSSSPFHCALQDGFGQI